MKLSFTEENYLKNIYSLSKPGTSVTTTAIANCIQTKPSSVTDMLDRLAEKKLIEYQKYKGVSLTGPGKKTALAIVRKHRLWEVFLVEKLGFTWDKVHDIAEQLEHIDSNELIERLDSFLGKPKFDPHGDAIPSKNGTLHKHRSATQLSNALPGYYTITTVLEDGPEFLKFLSQLGLQLNITIRLINRFDYNETCEIEITGKKKSIVLDKLSQEKILVTKNTSWKH